MTSDEHIDLCEEASGYATCIQILEKLSVAASGEAANLVLSVNAAAFLRYHHLEVDMCVRQGLALALALTLTS